jgi:hypothetical protein
MRSLPVPESVLKRHADAITPVSAKKKTQMIQVRRRRMILPAGCLAVESVAQAAGDGGG